MEKLPQVLLNHQVGGGVVNDFDDPDLLPPPEPPLDPVGVAIVMALATLALAVGIGGCLYLCR